MDNNDHQQFFTQLNKARKVFVAVPQNPSLDLAGAATALFLFFKKMEKEVEILAAEDYEQRFPFLPKTGGIRLGLKAEQSLAIVVDTRAKPLEELSYNQEEGQVKIFLKSGPRMNFLMVLMKK